ncbi:MAG: hypothetical protein WBM67_20340, partial [Sedimenticolaceae bacterium]
LCVANLRNSQLLRAIRALKTSPGAMFRESPEGVRRKEAPNSRACLITNTDLHGIIRAPLK